MSLLPVIIGVEDANGDRIDPKRPDGTRAPIMLRVNSDFGAIGTFDGKVSRVALNLNPANILPGPGEQNQVLLADVSGNPEWGSVADANVSASAAIAGTKVDPDFGAQDISTTGSVILGGSQSAFGSVRLGDAGDISTDGASALVDSEGSSRLAWSNTGLGFFGAAIVAQPDVTGSRGANAALASLLTALENLGLITDSTT